MTEASNPAATTEVATSPTVPAKVAPALVTAPPTPAEKVALAKGYLEAAKTAYMEDDESYKALTEKPGTAIRLIQDYVAFRYAEHCANLEGRPFSFTEAQNKLVLKVTSKKWNRAVFINGMIGALFLGSQGAQRVTVQASAIHIASDGSRSIMLPSKAAKGTFAKPRKAKVDDTAETIAAIAIENMTVKRANILARIYDGFKVSVDLMQTLGKQSFDVVGLAAKAKTLAPESKDKMLARWVRLSDADFNELVARRAKELAPAVA